MEEVNLIGIYLIVQVFAALIHSIDANAIDYQAALKVQKIVIN
jgi:hypothetical protein